MLKKKNRRKTQIRSNANKGQCEELNLYFSSRKIDPAATGGEGCLQTRIKFCAQTID
jgi:hypothetical protein